MSGERDWWPEAIEIFWEELRGIRLGFHVRDKPASRIGEVLGLDATKRLQTLMFYILLAYLFVVGSFFYLIYSWYPAQVKKSVREW